MRSVLTALAALIGIGTAFAQGERRLEFNITGAGQQTIYLANYYGNRLYYSDTAVADAQGTVVFDRKGGYPAGVYAVMVGAKRFEVAVNEPVVRMASDFGDMQGRATVTESRENALYLEQKKINDGELTPAAIGRLKDIVKANPGTLVAMIVKMGLAPERTPVLKTDGTLDSAATATLYRSHFWEGTDLRDARILNTPVFQNKLDEFFGRDVPQKVDSINHYLDLLIGGTVGAGAVFNFLLTYATTKYETSALKMDGVYVHIAQKYVCTGTDFALGAGMPADKWDKVCTQARTKAPLVIGNKSHNLILADTTEQHWVDMHKMPQECILVAFWSPHCGHCKKAMPALYTEYTEKLKALDVGVYAVADASDSTLFVDWKAFLKENKMDWVNVGVPFHVRKDANAHPERYVPKITTMESLQYATAWAVTGTPQYYLLDGQRRIIGKPDSITEIVSMIKAHKKRLR